MVPSDHFILTGSFKPDCLHTNVIAAATENTSSQCPHSGDNLHIVTRLEHGQNQERKDVYYVITMRKVEQEWIYSRMEWIYSRMEWINSRMEWMGSRLKWLLSDSKIRMFITYFVYRKFLSEGEGWGLHLLATRCNWSADRVSVARPAVKSIIIVKVITYNLQSNNTIYTISTTYLHHIYTISTLSTPSIWSQSCRSEDHWTTAAPTPTINVILDIFHFLYFPLLIRSIFCPSIAISPLSCRDCKGN